MEKELLDLIRELNERLEKLENTVYVEGVSKMKPGITASDCLVSEISCKEHNEKMDLYQPLLRHEYNSVCKHCSRYEECLGKNPSCQHSSVRYL